MIVTVQGAFAISIPDIIYDYDQIAEHIDIIDNVSQRKVQNIKSLDTHSLIAEIMETDSKGNIIYNKSERAITRRVKLENITIKFK